MTTNINDTIKNQGSNDVPIVQNPTSNPISTTANTSSSSSLSFESTTNHTTDMNTTTNITTTHHPNKDSQQQQTIYLDTIHPTFHEMNDKTNSNTNTTNNTNNEQQNELKRRKQEMNAFAAMANAQMDDIPNSSNRGNLEGIHDDTIDLVKDEARRKQEMNMFAAMANADIDDTTDLAKDEARRKQEMNMFAAMANADINDTNNLAKDEARRKQEMNMFAAMANADVADTTDSAKDEARRKQEMNMFAAMANADIADADDVAKDETRRKQEMNMFAAMANADINDTNNLAKDEARRKQEMNMFAAMANADVADTTDLEKDEARRKQEMNMFAAMANADVGTDEFNNSSITSKTELDSGGKTNYFTAEANILNINNEKISDNHKHQHLTKNDISSDKASLSGINDNQSIINGSAGTFISAKKPSTSNESNRNLDAALASLESDGGKRNNARSDKRKNRVVSLGSLPEANQVKQRKPQYNQMYSECVRIAKPLFFGSEIHPRILNEAKALEADCSHLLSSESRYEVTNLESCFAVFGPKSRTAFPEMLSKNDDIVDNGLMRSNDYVTLYEPVWGDFRRLHREDRILGYEADEFVSSGSKTEAYEDENETLEPSPKTKDSDDLNYSSNSSTESQKLSEEPINKENNNDQTREKYNTADSPDLFSKYARGDFDTYGKSLLWEKNPLPPVIESAPSDLNSTFRQINNDPKGSFEGSELKKQVGLNDNISKALKSLSVSSGLGGTSAASLTAADAGAAAIEAARAISVGLKDGRPLSNLEMVGGRVPLYGCDDSPLPVPNDLGIFETEEDQYQSMMQLEAQEIISSRAVPNIFGSIVCPSNCSGPDDSQNWFSNRNCFESTPKGEYTNKFQNSSQMERVNATRSSRFTSSTDSEYPMDERSGLPSPLPPPPTNRPHQSTVRTHFSRESNVSFGQHLPPSHPLKHERVLDDQSTKHKLDQRIGWWNISDDFGLKPKKQKSNNKGSIVPPLQLPPNRNERRHDFSWSMYPSQDKLINENRSFCELHPAVDTIKCLPHLSDRDPSVRHVQIETQIVSFPSVGEIEPFFCSMAIWHIDSERKDSGDVDLINSGRITEFLHFDVVDDPEVEQNCLASLWPHQKHVQSKDAPVGTDANRLSNYQLQGTRCGVFPLHARYNMDNLHAVLIVHKTLAEENELDVYISPSKQKVDEKNQHPKQATQDLNRYRQRAGKSAERFGQLLMPFAFGVAPLIQILGPNPPKIPASRAAQIPLFKFNAGEGDAPIINHILALGSPGDPDLVPAELAKDGTAMLVLRNFGFLGLHSSIHPHSKLACDRLVDFTGDKQVRRRRPGEVSDNLDNQSGHEYIVDAWHTDFLGESTTDGGRAATLSDSGKANSPSYSLELAQLPLQYSRSGLRDVNFKTSFSNELMIGPRTLQNCSKRNITIKVEIRRLQSSSDKATTFAILPSSPMMHNTRRGPFLVESLYTSCAYHKVDPKFIDEFKVKLPLSLHDGRKSDQNDDCNLVAFFSVYHVSVKGKKKWSIMNGKGEDEEHSFPLELLGCGYLPLSTNADAPCLITDGFHNVKLEYITKGLPTTAINGHDDETGTFITSPDTNGISHSQSTLILEKIDSMSKNNNFDNNEDDNKGKIEKNMILRVETIGFSSVHVQNPALAQFFSSMPSPPRCKLEDEHDTFEHIFEKEDSTLQIENEEQSLLHHTKQIGNSSTCPVNEIVSHFLRVNFHLWRAFVSGRGEPSSEWANPASIIPLRIHSFSNLLYILNSISHCLAKQGVTDLNGKGKWNMVSMSKIVLMIFDEDSVLPGPHEKVCETFFDKALYVEDNKAEDNKETSESVDDVSNLTRAILSLNKLDESQKKSSEVFSTEIGWQDQESKISSQDDIDIMTMDFKPSPLRARSSSAPNATGLKIDTKSDFQTALNSSISPTTSPFERSTNGPAANRRKWMTLPSSSLATIQEDNDKIDDRCDDVRRSEGSGDTLDTEMFKTKASKVKQFRVPKINQSSEESSGKEDSDTASLNIGEARSNNIPAESVVKVVPTNDEDIANAGTAFLDMIGKNFGYDVSTKELGGEEKRVGVSHHRKTKSRCSVDWSLPPTDLLIENYQEMEVFNRRETKIFHDKDKSSISPVNAEDVRSDVTQCDGPGEMGKQKQEHDLDAENKKDDHPIHRQDEQDVEQKTFVLPSFRDRITQLHAECEGRWFPYTYEVVILQWAAILAQQTKRKQLKKVVGIEVESNGSTSILRESAHKARGVSIACAPILFDIVKKSLGFRINSVFRNAKNWSSPWRQLGTHPLVELDETLTSTLTELIKTVTDACIDCRNFDSWSFRRTSIIVNDSIAKFLRDLFALLDTKVVHKLILTYFQRFVVKDGKSWQDRDSKIGLRCSWEICKLRLNSISLFIRFSDFIKVNKPLMLSWGPWSLGAPNRSTRRLFTKALNELEGLNMADFAVEGPVQNDPEQVPDVKAHWLLELITDICLSATGHVEQNIQHRAAALLYELFWTTSVEGKINGSLTVLASMYVPFLRKILHHLAFLANLTPKSQLRRDILTCVVFVMQSAPFGLLRSLWRNLCLYQGNQRAKEEEKVESKRADKYTYESSILDVCGLLNLCFKTFEYEGSEVNLEEELGGALSVKSSQWQREFLLSSEKHQMQMQLKVELSDLSDDSKKRDQNSPKYTSTSSRKWFSHDIAIVIINASRNIVREYLSILRPTEDYDSLSGPIAHFSHVVAGRTLNETKSTLNAIDHEFSYDEKVNFARAIASVYLNCLSLRQSDIVYMKTLIASIEILKVFGIELFLSAVGETLQHWMRVILVHCGARRAKVRVEASDFLALILRLTWDSYGSFFRVRIPLLAVQTEVMERIVATAASRYYKEQRRMKIPVQYLSNECAEAALTPLWRTLHRLHHSSASNNAAFKSALELLASRMKILYKAYIAAHALAIVTRTNALPKEVRSMAMTKNEHHNQFQIKRVVMESACFSKSIVGNRSVPLQDNAVTHNEVVEDSFLAAADIFSSTELPLHRIAWLRKLAEFHSSCNKIAEEGACRLEIHHTLSQAVKLHGHLWSSIPFWPWASDSTDGVHLDGEGPAGNNGSFDIMGDHEDNSDISYKVNGLDEGKFIEQDQSFRRIFYRVANSVRMKTGEWDVGGNKTLFYGVTFASEYDGVPPWTSLREIEEDMVEEAEAAGDLFLQAGLVESSRFCWNTATNFYSKVFNYPKLSFCYRKLSLVVASQVPIVDSSNQLEVFSPLGRFYRVHFHGSAADELMGKEFVYRASISVKLDEFCNGLCSVLTSILPDKTPINLVLDVGRKQEPMRSKQRRPLGAASREAITIKVTPLRALLRFPCPRGTSEWFYRQLDGNSTILRDLSNGFNTTLRSNHSSVAFGRTPEISKSSNSHKFGSGAVVGVNKFSFTQHRDRQRASRDVLKSPNGIVVEKSLKVTELQVDRNLPSCVTRQAVIQRTVFIQSPLEAAVEVVCSWCAVLFQTAVATNGLAVIGTHIEQGIGTRAEKVVADCIHKSRLKEIGRNMLNGNNVDQEDSSDISMPHYERLSLEEIEINQKKLARAIVIFMELLHVLVGRNRDLLLTALDDRKRRDLSSNESCSDRGNQHHPMIPPSPGQVSATSEGRSFFHEDAYHASRGYDDGNNSSIGYGGTSASSTVDRTDKAMAIQRELQRAFIAMCKILHPIVSNTIRNECPRWMKMSCLDNYFSGGFYRQARIALGEELLFFDNSNNDPHDGLSQNNDPLFVPLSILPTQSSSSQGSEESTINSKASDSLQGSRY